MGNARLRKAGRGHELAKSMPPPTGDNLLITLGETPCVANLCTIMVRSHPQRTIFSQRHLPSPMDRYVVIGNPVSHSLSPAIHAHFARQTGEPLEYATLEAPRDDFASAARRFFEGGGAGANVTLPF